MHNGESIADKSALSGQTPKTDPHDRSDLALLSIRSLLLKTLEIAKRLKLARTCVL